MFRMNKTTRSLAGLRQQFHARRRQLGQGGYLSHGSVQDRTRRLGGGAGYQWTRKVGQKTITVALTAPQYQQMKQAIANHRQLRRQIAELEKLSRRIIFQIHPHPGRHKRLSRRVLGVN